MTIFGEELIQSLSEAVEMAEGAEIGKVHEPIDPRAIRKRAKLTQTEMARLLDMSPSGYRKWEQGERTISGPAKTLLRVLDKNPRAVIEALAG